MSTQPSGPPNVLLVVDEDTIDRFGSVVRHLCIGMMDEPVRITVLSSSGRPDDAMGPARVVRLPRAIWPWRRWRPGEVLDELDIDPPDIVHCFSPRLFERMRPWAAAWDSALVAHLTDLVDVRQFAAMDLAGPIHAICVTPTVERVLLDLRPEVRDVTRVVPVGSTAQAEPACLSQPDRVPACIVTAPLTRDSGVDGLLRSLQRIVTSGQEVQVFLLSSGPAERSFRRLGDQLGVLHHVTFAVQMRNWSMVEEAMRGADFYIMPGLTRRFTATRLTALACGLAIIAPRGTSEDYLIDGTTARLFDPSRPEQLTDAWLGLLDDRTAARQLAETALDYARAHHQASAMATATAWLYQEIHHGAGHVFSREG